MSTEWILEFQLDEARDLIRELEAEVERLTATNAATRSTFTRLADERDRALDSSLETKRLRAALILAEDVLSRSPFSNHMWPNGMHPQVGMEQIRAALEAKP